MQSPPQKKRLTMEEVLTSLRPLGGEKRRPMEMIVNENRKPSPMDQVGAYGRGTLAGVTNMATRLAGGTLGGLERLEASALDAVGLDKAADYLRKNSGGDWLKQQGRETEEILRPRNPRVGGTYQGASLGTELPLTAAAYMTAGPLKAAVGSGLASISDKPKESMAGILAALAKSEQLKKLSESQTGRVLTDVATSAVPDVAIAATKFLGRAAPAAARAVAGSVQDAGNAIRMGVSDASAKGLAAADINNLDVALKDVGTTAQAARKAAKAEKAVSTPLDAALSLQTTTPATRGRGNRKGALDLRLNKPLGGSTPAIRAVNTTLVGADDISTAQSQWLTRWQRFVTQNLDQEFPLAILAKAAEGIEGESAMQGFLAQRHGARGAAGDYLRSNLTPVLESLKKSGPEAESDLWALMDARRTLQLATLGSAKKSSVDLATHTQAVLDAEKNPAVVAAADKIYGMYKYLLRQRFNVGLITEAEYKATLASEDFYTKFIREVVPAGDKMSSSGFRVKRIKGVEKMNREKDALQRKLDPISSMVLVAHRTFDDVANHQIQSAVASIAESGGAEGLVRARPTNAKGVGAPYSFAMKGKTYEVLEPALAEAIASQSYQARDLLMRLMSAAKTVKQIGVTIMPDFAVTNIGRDVAMSAVQSRRVGRSLLESGAGGLAGAGYEAATNEDAEADDLFQMALYGSGAGALARPIIRTVKAAAQVAGYGQEYSQYLRAGGSTSGYYVNTPKDVAAASRALRRSGVKASDIINPRSWYEGLQWLGATAEQTTRLAAFTEARASGATLAQAAHEAQDRTLPFAKHGSSKLIQMAAQTTAFFNPKLQGLHKLTRMLKRPETWGLGVAMITAPSMALWYENKDNPEYWDRPQWERARFWLKAKPEGGFKRIAKPFELGFLFASAPEAFFDYLARTGKIESAAPKEARPADVTADALLEMAVAPSEGIIPVPDIASLPAQLATGRDFFRNRNIVSRPNLPAERQVSDQSSAIARALATKAGFSPEKTDFAIRNIAGPAGPLVSTAVDALARRAGISAPEAKPDAKFYDPFIKRFNTNPEVATDPMIRALNRKDELDKVFAGLNDVRKNGTTAERKDYADRNKDDLQERRRSAGDFARIDRLYALRRKVSQNTRLLASDREARLAKIAEQAKRVAAAINAR